MSSWWRAFLLGGALALGLAAYARAEPPPCPSTPATVEVFVENLSADPTLAVTLAGELLDASATCSGTGATAYAETLDCMGAGLVRCGTVAGLQPGAWVNRLALTVAGSSPQAQAARTTFVGADAAGAVNRLVWTAYPRTFVVTEATEASLRAALDAAAAYTAASFGPALVTFDAAAFPGTADPRTIDLARGACAPEPSRHAALCLTGSRLAVDALDARGERGGVIWSVGTRPLSLLRLYGGDDVLRGLVLAGSRAAAPGAQLDTVAIVGAGAVRNRLEQSLVQGPSLGDAVSAQGAAAASVVDDCEITGAQDKGLKVTTGAQLTLRASCVHDNLGGGVQATLGGHVAAIENVVQHNVPGPAGNGLGAVGGDPAAPSTLATDGNVVRFAGGRGLSVVDDAIGTFRNDYVADNQFSGATVETKDTSAPGAAPAASFRGVAFVCNRNAGVSGSCQPQAGDDGAPCGTDADCCELADGCCASDPGCAAPLQCKPLAFPRGFGAAQIQAAGHEPPVVAFGDASEPGRNAFTLNRNHAPGANLKLEVPGATLAVEGNQWEHCGTGPSCDTAAVETEDLRLAAGAAVTLGSPPGARAGAPAIARLSPERPRAGELVRVFGDGFNAIEGAACAGTTAPAAPCSAENPPVELQNRRTDANRLRILAADGAVVRTLHPDAVTPTMLVFRMPFDCFAPLVLEVSKRDPSGKRLIATTPLCGPLGCAGAPAGVPCDDGDACTIDDRCDAGAVCAGTPVVCMGACLTGACDPAQGCVPRPAGTVCRPAADPCDVAERCTGTSAACPADVPNPEPVPCDDGDACTTGDTCGAGVCVGGPPAGCAACERCDPLAGCIALPRDGCRAPVAAQAARLVVNDAGTDASDALEWSWLQGAQTLAADFGDPTRTDGYALCIYDESRTAPRLWLRAEAPAGGTCGTQPCWRALGRPPGRRGFKYANRARTPDGLTSISLKPGEGGKAKIVVKGKGEGLALPSARLDALPLRVQLQAGNGRCWEAMHAPAAGRAAR